MNLNQTGKAGRTLVLGANGKTGRRVLRRLEALGHLVRAGSRNGVPRFDWDEMATWEPTLEGVESVYVTYQPDLAFPGAAETVEMFADLAGELSA